MYILNTIRSWADNLEIKYKSMSFQQLNLRFYVRLNVKSIFKILSEQLRSVIIKNRFHTKYELTTDLLIKHLIDPINNHSGNFVNTAY